MAAVELATGYVTLTAETSHLSKQIASAFSGAQSIGAKAGRQMGEAMAKSFNDSKPADLSDLEKKVSDAENRMTQIVEVSARKRKAAADAIVAAQTRLSAATEAHAAKVKLVEAAEANLQAVRTNENATSAQILAAESKLSSARSAATNAAASVQSAEARVTSAREKYVNVSRTATTQIASHADALKSAKKSLDEAKKANDELGDSAAKSGSVFGRIAGTFRKGFASLPTIARKGFRESFASADDEAEKSAKSSSNIFASTFKKALLAGGGLFAGAKLFSFGKDAISDAGDLEQSIGAVDSVFKSSAEQVHQWAQVSATSLGISENAYNELASVLGASLKNGGTSVDELAGKTNDLIALGADLASMYGGSTKEAIEAISAALRGETDPIERYGISINDAALSARALELGIHKTGGAFTTQQKQLLTQKLLFEQSTDAQGNFNRESDTYAHKVQVAQASWENFRAELGSAVLPAITSVMDVLAKFLQPILTEVTGGVRAFVASWNNLDGDVTSSGFAGFMEVVAFALRSVWEAIKKFFLELILPVLREQVLPFLVSALYSVQEFFEGLSGITDGSDSYSGLSHFFYELGTAIRGFVGFLAGTSNIWLPITAGLAAAIATIKAYMAYVRISTAITTAWSIATGVQEGALWGLTVSEWGVIAPIALVVAGIALIIGAFILAYNQIGWFRDFVDSVFAAIQAAIGAVVEWFQNEVAPLIGAVIGAIGDFFVQMYQSYIKPAWDWIVQAISDAIGWISENVVPVFTAIGEGISAAFGWIVDNVVPAFVAGFQLFINDVKFVFDGIVRAVQQIGPAFTWLYETIVKPVFTWIVDTVAAAVDWFSQNVAPALQVAFGGVLEWWNSTFGPAWDATVKGFGEVFGWVYENLIKPVWDWLSQTITGFVNWFQNDFLKWNENALNEYGNHFTWLYETIVKPVFGFIQSVVSAFVDWWNTSFMPPVQAGLQVLGDIFMWLYENVVKPIWTGIMIAITVVAAVIYTIIQGLIWLFQNVLAPVFTWLYETIVIPIWNGIQTVIQVVVDIVTCIINGFIWLFQNVLAPVFTWLYETIIKPIWNGIQAAIQFVIDVIKLEIDGWIAIFQNVLAPVFTWLYETIIKPIWDGIQAAIQIAVSIITGIINALTWMFQNIFAPMFTWLYDTIIKPVWDLIQAAIKAVWDWMQNILFPGIQAVLNAIGQVFQWLYDVFIKPVWDLIQAAIKAVWDWMSNTLIPGVKAVLDTLGGAFQWVYDTIIKPVWDGIQNTIKTVWDFVHDKVLDPMINFLKDTFTKAWESTADGIGKIWEGLKKLVAAPIKFVVGTVINDTFIEGYNKLNDFWGGGDLSKIDISGLNGYATGGYTGRGNKYDVAGVVHADEYVIRKESRKKFERDNPGALDQINRTGSIDGVGAAAGCPHCGGHHKDGAGAGHETTAPTSGPPPAGPHGGIWGGFQAQLSKAGHIYIPKKSFMGVNTEDVAHAWTGRSALDVRVGKGSPGIEFRTGGAGTWGFTQGNTIWMQNTVPQDYRRAVLIHELGHALSLYHTMNTGSIMHPVMKGPKWPSALDYGALARTWGNPGEGVKTYSDPGGGNSVLGWIAEKITSPFKIALQKAREAFGGNGFVDMPIGSAQKLLDGFVDWAAGREQASNVAGSGGAAWEGTVRDALGRAGLPTSAAYVNAWIRQIDSESGGNPNARQKVQDVNSRSGNAAIGLVQVTPSTFAHYRDTKLSGDPYEPLSNLTAGMRYAKARYGVEGMLDVIGHGHGYAAGGLVSPSNTFARNFAQTFGTVTPSLYDRGGLIHEGLQFIDHQRRTPDYVLTSAQWEKMFELAAHVEKTEGARGGITIGTVHGHSAEEVAAEIEKMRRRKEALEYV
ncbi:MAG: matrixin family metalloprotease [Rothia dentocariosa]